MKLRLLILVVLINGCASFKYSPTIERMGEFDPMTSSLSEKADEMSWDEAKEIKVYIGSAPKGFKLNAKGFLEPNNQNSIIAKVSAQISGNAMNSWWWFYDYAEDESWRKGFCWWQTPLVWVTLTWWAWISPTHIPCKVYDNSNSPAKIGARKERLIKTLQKAAKVVGANAVVVTKIGRMDFSVNGSSTVSSSVEMISAQGFAIKIKESGK